MKSKEEYYQANPIVQARRNYNLIEHQLFRLAIADLNPRLRNSQYYNEQFPTFHLSTDAVVKIFQGEEGNDHRIYEKLLLSARNMAKSNIEIGNAKAFKIFPVFDTIEFSVKDGLTVIFHRNMKPFLLDFDKGNYTRCYLQLAFELSSKNSLILLELMLQYRGMEKHNVIERKLTSEELKFALDIDENAYKGRMNNFRIKVIDPAIKEINEKTNYYINPEYKIERGRWRKIKAFVFTMILPDADAEGQRQPKKIKPKKEKLPAVDTSATQAPLEDVPEELALPEHNSLKVEESEQQEPDKPQKKLGDLTEKEVYALEKLLKFKINERKAFEILDKYGVKAIEWSVKNYYNTKNRGVAINNPAGFIIDKIPQYEESEITADDIFKLAEGFRAKKEEQRIKEKEEAEQQKAEENAKEEERKANREPWKEWEIQILAQNYIKNGNTFVDADKKDIKERGWTTSEILSKPEYMAYFHPNSEVSQYIRIRRKKNKAGDAN